MNKAVIILKIIFTASIAYFLQSVFPWWSAALSAFVIGFVVFTKPGASFFSGFAGIALLWLFMSFNTDGPLPGRVAEIFSLPNSALLVLVTAIIGGIAGGFGALTGCYLRNWILPRERQ